jgi:cephalosporin hydroxylase
VTATVTRLKDRLLDERALRRGAASHAEDLPPARDLDVVPLSLLRTTDEAELRDPGRLEREILPALGLNDEILEEFPEELYPYCGRGLRHWQYPNQFGPYLAFLSGQRVASYLEIGVRHGGTFLITIEYLSRFTRLRKALATDVVDSPFLRRQLRKRRGARFVLADSQLPEFRTFVEREGPFDLVLVDGAHYEHTCQHDLDSVRPHANIVVLHDIASDACPGVAAVWSRFREEEAEAWDFHEFTDQYDDVRERQSASYLGIGVAVRKQRLPS